MKKLFLISCVMVLGMTLAFGSAEAAEKTKTIKVGVIWGLTGPGSQQQLVWKDAVLLCADYINKKGGVTVKGEKYRIQCVVEDNKNSPAGSVDAATKLVHQEKVKFIVGLVVPVQIEGVMSVTEPNKVMYVSMRTDIVRPDKPYFFCAAYSYAAPLPGLYQVIREKYPSVKSVGYIVEDETGARAVGEISRNIARGMGFTVLEPEIHPWESSEYYPVWTKVLTQKPDAMDNGLKLPPNTAACVRHGRELGFKGPMMTSTAGDPSDIIKMIGKDSATDFLYPALDVYGPSAPPMVKEMVKLWEAKYKTRLDEGGPDSWDSLWSLVQAIEKAQSLDPTDVKNAWENMDTFQSVKGTAKMGGAKAFGIKHMGFPPCPIIRIQNAKVEFIRWFDPWMP
jgi:branched-chain amino acid transport system substrate-binding protein